MFGQTDAADEATLAAITSTGVGKPMLIVDCRCLAAATASASVACAAAAITVPLLLSDVVADARPTVNAYANMMNGGGYESEKNYPDMSIHFAEIPNIHVVRSSHQHLKQAAAAPLPPAVVQADEWTSVLSLILQAALLVVKAVHQDNSAVLVHCSDGW